MLANVSGYEEAVILNQLLYFAGTKTDEFTKTDLSIYDIYYLTSYDKSIPTLRKRLTSLIDKGLVIKHGSTLYGKAYYRPANDLFIENNDLITLIEGQDLSYGDYYAAAILNYFRQKLLSGEKKVTVSHNELKHILRIDKSRLSIRLRIKELLKSKIIKGKLTGRIYDYELSDTLLNNRSPEVIDELSDRLCECFTNHLKRFDNTPQKRMKLSFQRMLIDGYEYEAIRHIIAYLGYKRPAASSQITQVSAIRKHYAALYESAYLSLSKRKANKYLYKLCSGFYEDPKVYDVIPAYAAEREKQLVINEDLSDSELWARVFSWCEKRKYLIRTLFNRHKNEGYGNILEEEDIYNSILQIVFEHVKKHRNTDEISISTNYLERCVQSLLINNFSQSYIDIDDESISDQKIMISNNLPVIDDDYKAAVAIEKLKATDIPEEIQNIIIDSLALNGIRYTQRELASKYGKSLSKINRLLTKYIPIIKLKVRNSDPPH